MTRILFVDDQQGVLDGLARIMRRYRNEWELAFVEGGEAALAELERAPVDVIVTDVQMPGMTGDELLAIVRERSPGTARIVLSGEADHATACRLARSAHQFLAKPCPSETIRGTLERMAHLHARLPDPRVREMVGGVEELMEVPAIRATLARIAGDKTSSLEELVGVIERSPAASAKVIQIASSAFFVPPRSVAGVREAVSSLGLDTVRRVFAPAAADDHLPSVSAGADLVLNESWSRQVRAAALARAIMRRVSPDLADTAYLAGLLHDVGVLIALASSHDASPWCEDVGLGPGDGERRHEAGGATYAELGAGLLDLWGLPEGVVEAVAHQRSPARTGTGPFGVAGAVHVAQALVAERPILDLAYLEGVGVDSELPAWRELARSLQETVDGRTP